MKIFVTGGAGFIGRNLVQFLLTNGHEVTIFDNLSNSNEVKIQDLISGGALFIKGDITNYEFLKSSLKGNFDHVIHLAAKISVNDSISNPEETNLVNITGSLRVLRACIENNISSIVAASSVAVYGDARVFPISENFPTRPISPYGASKVAMENYLSAFSNMNELNSISLRISNIYGKGQSNEYAGVITRFYENIKNNQSLQIYGDGSQTRDFVSIIDVIQAFDLAIKNSEGKKGDIFNIGFGKGTRIDILAKKMISVSKKEINLETVAKKPGEIHDSQVSIKLAKKELKYEPKISLEDGLKKIFKDLS